MTTTRKFTVKQIIAIRAKEAAKKAAAEKLAKQKAARRGFFIAKARAAKVAATAQSAALAALHSDPGPRGDLLAEQEVWRVVAAPGRSADHGVCELANASGEWRLRTVID